MSLLVSPVSTWQPKSATAHANRTVMTRSIDLVRVAYSPTHGSAFSSSAHFWSLIFKTKRWVHPGC